MHDHYTLETHYYGPNHRVRVVPDDWPQECPIEWNESDSGILTVRAPRSYNHLQLGIHADDAKVAMDYADEYGTDDEPYEAALRRLRRLGFSADYYSLSGHSQSDWMDVIMWVRKPTEPDEIDYLDPTAQAVQSWFAGDIYSLIHEERVEYVRADNRDAENPDLVEWEEVDRVGGFYLDPWDEAEVTSSARDHFTIPEPTTV